MHVDLADNAVVATLLSSREQVGVQYPSQTLASALLGDDDTVDVQKPVVAAPKPFEVDAVVSSVCSNARRNA